MTAQDKSYMAFPSHSSLRHQPQLSLVPAQAPSQGSQTQVSFLQSFIQEKKRQKTPHEKHQAVQDIQRRRTMKHSSGENDEGGRNPTNHVQGVPTPEQQVPMERGWFCSWHRMENIN